MLRDYVLIFKENKFYFELNCDEKLTKELIKEYTNSVKKYTIRGLYRHFRQQGYKVNELISSDEVETILNF